MAGVISETHSTEAGVFAAKGSHAVMEKIVRESGDYPAFSVESVRLSTRDEYAL